MREGVRRRAEPPSALYSGVKCLTERALGEPQDDGGIVGKLSLRKLVTNDRLVTMTRKRDERRDEVVVPAAEFKAKCLAFFDEVELRRRCYVVTKRGRPVARVIPLPSRPSRSLRGSLLFEEDLVGPIDVDWDAQA